MLVKKTKVIVVIPHRKTPRIVKKRDIGTSGQKSTEHTQTKLIEKPFITNAQTVLNRIVKTYTQYVSILPVGTFLASGNDTLPSGDVPASPSFFVIPDDTNETLTSGYGKAVHLFQVIKPLRLFDDQTYFATFRKQQNTGATWIQDLEKEYMRLRGWKRPLHEREVFRKWIDTQAKTYFSEDELKDLRGIFTYWWQTYNNVHEWGIYGDNHLIFSYIQEQIRDPKMRLDGYLARNQDGEIMICQPQYGLKWIRTDDRMPKTQRMKQTKNIAKLTRLWKQKWRSAAPFIS